MSDLSPNPAGLVDVDRPVYGTGDKVRLRQGGPLMLVSENHDGQIECVWVEYGMVPQRDYFAADQLMPASGSYPENFEALQAAIGSSLIVLTDFPGYAAGSPD